MQKTLQSMLLNLIVLTVFAVLIALAVIAIKSAAADQGDAAITKSVVLEVPAAQTRSAGILRR